MGRFIPAPVRVREQLLGNARCAIQDLDGKRIDYRAGQGNAPFRYDLELDRLFVDPQERPDPSRCRWSSASSQQRASNCTKARSPGPSMPMKMIRRGSIRLRRRIVRQPILGSPPSTPPRYLA